jgi:hypothetical protein
MIYSDVAVELGCSHLANDFFLKHRMTELLSAETRQRLSMHWRVRKAIMYLK